MTTSVNFKSGQYKNVKMGTIHTHTIGMGDVHFEDLGHLFLDIEEGWLPRTLCTHYVQDTQFDFEVVGNVPQTKRVLDLMNEDFEIGTPEGEYLEEVCLAWGVR